MLGVAEAEEEEEEALFCCFLAAAAFSFFEAAAVLRLDLLLDAEASGGGVGDTRPAAEGVPIIVVMERANPPVSPFCLHGGHS